MALYKVYYFFAHKQDFKSNYSESGFLLIQACHKHSQ